MLCSSIFLITLYVLSVGSETTPYDSFQGCPLSDSEYKEFTNKNIASICTNKIEPCNPDEGRRIDGTCNNLKHPSKGAAKTPLYRLLPAVFNKEGDYYEPRKARNGNALPLARKLRSSFIAESKVPDPVFTQLVALVMEFTSSDVLVNDDTDNYIFKKPYCCLPKGKTDPECTPIKVPVDDPVHRFSGISCLNLTRPISFQSLGCAKKNSVPARYSTATPQFDLSNVYGTSLESLKQKGRLGEKGLLKYEIEDGRVWPPSEKNKHSSDCVQNHRPAETRCNDTPDGVSNFLFGTMINSIWFWRHHNFIAKALYKINPHWDDDKLFYIARDINIAVWNQILYYELLPSLMGKNNLLRDNVISKSPGFRDVYDDQKVPQLLLEYIAALRWCHTIQDSDLKMYDPDGHYLGKFPITNMTFRTGWLAVDDNIDYITQGSFRQHGGKIDYVVDPYMSELGLGGLQLSSDLLTSDLTKNRYFGIGPYVNYRKFCSGKTYKKFDDLQDLFYPENLELLKEHYQKVDDIDLIAGIWLEKHVKGGYTPETLYCIMKEQLYRFLVSDRHWYERPNRPNAFTKDQLLQIRKASISRFLCDVGDTVTKIQPKGFLRAGSKNKICSCDKIPGIDYNAWKDSSCEDK